MELVIIINKYLIFSHIYQFILFSPSFFALENWLVGGELAPNPAGEEAPETPESTTTAKPKPSTYRKAEKAVNTVVSETSKLTKVPPWGVVTIFIGIIIVICGVVFFCVRRFFRKRRGKDGKKGMKGVDLKSVQLLGSAYKEKVT